MIQRSGQRGVNCNLSGKLRREVVRRVRCGAGLPWLLAVCLWGAVAPSQAVPAEQARPALQIPRGRAERVEVLLDAATPVAIDSAGRTYGTAAFAVAGTNLAARIFVRDLRAKLTTLNWGGVVEISGASEDGHAIRQVIFQIESNVQKGTAKGFANGKELPDPPPVAWVVAYEDGGYILSATVPLDFFGWQPDAAALLLDVAVTTLVRPNTTPQVVRLYSTNSAGTNSSGYGRATIVAEK